MKPFTPRYDDLYEASAQALAQALAMGLEAEVINTATGAVLHPRTSDAAALSRVTETIWDDVRHGRCQYEDITQIDVRFFLGDKVKARVPLTPSQRPTVFYVGEELDEEVYIYPDGIV